MPTERGRVLRVGLTGGIAAGKSEVARRLAALGAFVIDADRLAREVVAAGTPGHAAVVERFGSGIVGADGAIDRAALAQIVFADAESRSALNAIIHPLVRAAAAAREQTAAVGSIVVHDIPLLVETGQQGDFDVVVVVDAARETQARRLQERRGLSDDDVARRLAAQAPREQRLAAADLVIHNDGSLEDLDRQVADCWARLAAWTDPEPERP